MVGSYLQTGRERHPDAYKLATDPCGCGRDYDSGFCNNRYKHSGQKC